MGNTGSPVPMVPGAVVLRTVALPPAGGESARSWGGGEQNPQNALDWWPGQHEVLVRSPHHRRCPYLSEVPSPCPLAAPKGTLGTGPGRHPAAAGPVSLLKIDPVVSPWCEARLCWLVSAAQVRLVCPAAHNCPVSYCRGLRRRTQATRKVAYDPRPMLWR